jgi:hypothetical protein
VPSTALVLVVFGRGVLAARDGYALTGASAARVRAAADYVAAHEGAFAGAAARGPSPRIVLAGGWAEACEGAPEPPVGCREGDLMLRAAREAGLDRYAELLAETRSRSTLENVLHLRRDGLLAGHAFDPARPLGLVSHPWHLPRVRFLAGKVLRLRGPALLDVPAGGDVPRGWRSERALLLGCRLCFAGTRDPAAMLRRERWLVAAVRRAGPGMGRASSGSTVSGDRRSR